MEKQQTSPQIRQKPQEKNKTTKKFFSFKYWKEWDEKNYSESSWIYDKNIFKNLESESDIRTYFWDLVRNIILWENKNLDDVKWYRYTINRSDDEVTLQ